MGKMEFVSWCLLLLCRVTNFTGMDAADTGWGTPPFSAGNDSRTHLGDYDTDLQQQVIYLEENVEWIIAAKLNYTGQEPPTIVSFYENRTLGAILIQDPQTFDYFLCITKLQDYETTSNQQYSFSVGGNGLTFGIFLLIQNIDDCTPDFSMDEKSCLVPENCELSDCSDALNNTCTITIHDADGKIDGDVVTDVVVNILEKGNNSKEFSLLKLKNKSPYEMEFSLQVKQKLDFETKSIYMLNITAQDAAGHVGFTSYMVQVKDLPDENPKWIKSVYVKKVKEESEDSIEFKAIDGDFDIQAEISYRIDLDHIPQDQQKYFKMDSTTGLLSIIKIDRDVPDNTHDAYVFPVIAYETENKSSSISLNLTVLVEDINDNEPTIFPPNIAIAINETATKLNFGQSVISVADGDLVESGRYTLTLMDSIWAEAFLLVPEDGYQTTNVTISILNPSKLDYEDPNWRNIVLDITATELANQSHIGHCVVQITLLDINDEKPKFSFDSYNVTIPEDVQANTVVLNVTATDADYADLNRLSYALLPAQQGLRINDMNGSIFVAADNVFDYEVQQKFILQVQAEDTAGHITYVQLTVSLKDVNDEAPTISVPSSRINVTENSPVNTTVVTLLASDPDSTADLRFYIDWDSSYAKKQGVTTENRTLFVGCLKINTNKDEFGTNISGTVEVDNVIDWEAYDTIYLTVVVKDNNTDSAHCENKQHQVVLMVEIDDKNDNPPVFLKSSYAASVVENSKIDQLITIITATDADGPGNNHVSYEISVKNETTPKDWVSIDNSTGKVLVNSAVIDCEKADILIYTVTATDGPHHTYVDLIITVDDVNEYTPQYNETNHYSTTLDEEPADGTILAGIQLATYDYDRSVPFHTVTYQLDTTKNPTITNFFMINNETGVIAVKYNPNGASPKDLDFDTPAHELRATYEIPLIIRDNFLSHQYENSLVNRSGTVRIQFCDINDNVPQFEPVPDCLISLDEDIKQKTVYLERLKVEDKDSECNAQIGFSIYNNADFEVQTNHNNTASLIIKESLLGRPGNYSVTFEATDQHGCIGYPPGHSHSSNFTYSICVRDINDHIPEFSYPGNNSVMKLRQEQTEGSELIDWYGHPVKHVQASDADTGQNAELTYLITGDDYAVNHLRIQQINNTHAKLCVTRLFESDSTDFQLILTATDNGSPKQLKSSVVINTIIRSLINHPPTFSTPSLIMNFKENTTGLGQSQTIPKATDIDNENHQYFNETEQPIYYFIIGGAKDNFNLNKVSGELVVNPHNVLDREIQDHLTLIVGASNDDSAESSFSDPGSILNITIQVIDVIDTAPEFWKDLLVGSVATGYKMGTLVFTAEANDQDINDTVKYRIMSNSMEVHGNNLDSVKDNAFAFTDETSGKLQLVFNVNTEMSGYFVFKVEAYDKGNNSNSIPAKVFIVSESNKVRFYFTNQYEVVNNRTDQISDILTKHLSYKCVIDDIKHEDSGSKAADDVTVAITYFIDMQENEAVAASDISLKLAVSETMRQLKLDMAKDQLVLEGATNDDSPQVEETDNTQTLLIIICTVLASLLIILIVSFLFKARSLNRKLQAMSAAEFKPQISGVENTLMAAPNTNQLPSNPIWDTEINVQDLDNASISSGDSDLIGIEENPDFRLNSSVTPFPQGSSNKKVNPLFFLKNNDENSATNDDDC